MKLRSHDRRKSRSMAVALVLGAGALASFGVALTSGKGHATAPQSRYTSTSTTVFDNVTKLTWQLATKDASKLLWANAAAYCDLFASSGLGERPGWRLPSVSELETIVDASHSDPAIDISAFSSQTPPDSFWTATTYAPDGSSKWVVDFSDGSSYDLSILGSAYVRCVH